MAGASPVQTQEDLVPPAPAAIGYRLSGVLLAPAVAAAVHVAIIGPFGVDLQVPEIPGGTLTTLPILTTTLITLGVALVGWLAVVLLERGLGGPRGRRIWTLLAFALFTVSLVPIIAIDAPISAKWGLFALHVVVALLLIPSLANGQQGPPLTRGNVVPRPAAHHAEAPADGSAAAAEEDTHAVDTHVQATGVPGTPVRDAADAGGVPPEADPAAQTH
ncbi:hypothetical protein BH23ACT9_BH23ACT9_03650 [soil metagenome]